MCVCAGDVTNSVSKSVHWAGEISHSMPVVLVPGNHEFYGGSVFEGLEWGRQAAAEYPDVHLLSDNVVVLGGVRFLGSTLWTDFKLGAQSETDVMWNAANAANGLNDFKSIAWRTLPRREAFTAEHSRQAHQRSRHYLKAHLLKPFAGPTVVVTHHAPHPLSVHTRWQGSNLSPAFASDLTNLIMEGRPELWVHGHMHNSSDYVVGETRVLCNPKGYHAENGTFQPGLVIEIGDGWRCPDCGREFHDAQPVCPACGGEG